MDNDMYITPKWREHGYYDITEKTEKVVAKNGAVYTATLLCYGGQPIFRSEQDCRIDTAGESFCHLYAHTVKGGSTRTSALREGAFLLIAL